MNKNKKKKKTAAPQKMKSFFVWDWDRPTSELNGDKFHKLADAEKDAATMADDENDSVIIYQVIPVMRVKVNREIVKEKI